MIHLDQYGKLDGVSRRWSERMGMEGKRVERIGLGAWFVVKSAVSLSD